LLKGLFNIIVKEVKELVRDPKILLPMIIIPLIMFPIMGFAIQTSRETAEESIGKTSIALMDLDEGSVAESLENYLALFNFTIIRLDDLSLNEAITQVQESNLTNLIVIPSGFSQNITEGGTSNLEVYTPFRGGGIIESTRSSTVSNILSSFETAIVDQRIKEGFRCQSRRSIRSDDVPVCHYASGNNVAAHFRYATCSYSGGVRERRKNP